MAGKRKLIMLKRQYAEYRGISEESLSQASKRGKLVLTGNGRVDVKASDRLFKEAESGSVPNIAHAGDSLTPDTPDGEQVFEDLSSVDQFIEIAGTRNKFDRVYTDKEFYVHSRAVNEFLKAQKERVKLQQLTETVIDRGTANDSWFKEGRRIRDFWLNWPKTVAVQMAAELGIEARTMNDILLKYIKEALRKIAKSTLDVE